MAKRDFLTDDDVTPAELIALIDGADRHKAARRPSQQLTGKTVALIFEKPSTRTRVSFEVGVQELGGYPLPLSAGDLQLGRGETVEDTAQVLSRYVHAAVLRTFEQEKLEKLATGTIPVVNSLSDFSHPCQALADLQTIREKHGTFAGLKLVYMGDGNNVAHSLMIAGAKVGMKVVVACPEGYDPLDSVLKRAQEIASETGGSVEVSHDPAAAAQGAHVLYTDVWASMGQEAEAVERRKKFEGFQISAAHVAAADPKVVVMHCLPAHRGEEIAAEVLDGPHSVVFDQAENRLHAQKALLTWLLVGTPNPEA